MTLKKIWQLLISIELCLALLALLCVAMAGGSFLLKGEYAAAINSVPLMVWLLEAPAGVSWWLWLTVVLLALLVINTLLCSSETLWSRRGRAGLPSLLAPQLIHAGFLLIVLAHLVSAYGGRMQQVEVMVGSVVQLPDRKQFGVTGIDIVDSPMGIPVGYGAELMTDFRRPAEQVRISPNHPWFTPDGFGVYIKQAERYPYRRALLEIHREPGAGMALAGALVFTIGNIMLVWLRSRARDYAAVQAGNKSCAGI